MLAIYSASVLASLRGSSNEALSRSAGIAALGYPGQASAKMKCGD